MPSFSAASRALARSREAIAAISETSPRCIAGITFSTAILATPRTPHLTLRNPTPSLLNRILGLRRRHAALRLPRQHPTRMLERAHCVERSDLLGAQRQIGCGEIVV